MDRTPSYTSPEAANRLRLPTADARVILRAAGVARLRVGGAYLWNQVQVEALARALREAGLGQARPEVEA